MAAEVPAKDVLCEAMDYLSKLGSNLRARSENLKEKKIRREKLNNVLAVQKAAGKVLLICELSKKSLENVETGVRKVLELIDTSQAPSSSGGKISLTEKEVAVPKYYYLEYKTRKLRMKNRISFKHYNSVKVHVKMLPKSMMDKYPVHYDCKLYRMRRRETQEREQQTEVQNVNKETENEEVDSIQNNVSIITIPDTPISENNNKNLNNDMSTISIPVSPEPKLDDGDRKLGLSSLGKERKFVVETTKESSASRGGDQSPRKKSNMPDKYHRSREKDHREKKRSPDYKEDQKRTSKRKRIIFDDSSDDDKISDVINVETENVLAIKDDDSGVSCHESDSKKQKLDENSKNDMKSSIDENISEKTENVLAIKDDDSGVSCHESDSKKQKLDENSKNDMKSSIDENISEKTENVLAIKDDDSGVSCHESDAKKQKLDENSKNDMKSSIDENISKKDTDKNDDTPNDVVKPLIKCVSLSKLLKPNILPDKKVVGPHSKPKDSSNKAKQEEEARQATKAAKQTRKEKEEQEYWSQKKEEVRSFKPKNFVINVTRLPELSISYLNKLCLRKITQAGNTVCEITENNLNEKTVEQKDDEDVEQKDDDNDEQKDDYNDKTVKTNKKSDRKINEPKSKSKQASTNSPSDHDNDIVAEANKIDSLLNEFDSDDAVSSDSEFKLSNKDNENIKNALLKDSDSESKQSDEVSKSKVPISETEQAKNALCRESDSESDKIEPESTAQFEKDNAPSNSISDVEVDTVQSDSDSDDVEQRKSNSKKDVTSAATKKISSRSPSEKDYDSGDKNVNENAADSSVQKNDENISQCQKNEKTPEKEEDTARSSLLNDSSDDKTKTPLSLRLTPQSKKKRTRDIHANKILLTSSSDTDDEQLKNAIKDIKDALLYGSDEENKKKKQLIKSSSSSSGEDIIKNVKKKRLLSKEKRSKKKQLKIYRKSLVSEDDSKHSDDSISSSSKMVRSKSKPGNSSSQNSDAPDSNDKSIDGLINLNTLNKLRHQNSKSPEMSESSASERETSKQRSKSISEPTGLISDEILAAESSSESAVASAEEDDDDVPEITLPSMNGGGEHLVKEDLLAESDSSASHNDVVSVKEESGSEDKPNTKRRKVNAISSDSEVGSSRKKDADVKLSDFDDSDDSDINNKRSKRKKKGSDSDASVATTSSNEGGKKKRRRIRSVRDSDVSGSESETEGRNKHGRKNIRKVMGKNQLEEATKKAAREEKERVARIAERQKMYNNLEFDESGKPDEVVLDKVVLDFDPETKEPLIEVDRGLVKKLKPHQANGIKFMWNACFESVKRIKKDKGSGCILAHCMGLGKTLQVVSLTHTLLTHSDLTRVKRVLVVCPLSTVLNWVNEFHMWLKFAETEYDVEVFELSRYKQNSERAFQLSQWIRHGGVCVLGYEMFRNLSADNSKKFKKKMLQTFQEALVDPGPDLVVCDEGHLLKNERTSLSQSMNRVKSLRRIVLTGTPLQNNLKEYYCMVQFVKPNLLGKYNEYLNRFVNPITNGQYTDSTEHDIKIMKRRSHVLHKMLDGAVQRRDYGVLAPFLPPKHEYVLFITLSEVQTKLYQHYLDNFSRKPAPGKSSGFLFPDFQSLQRIWTHPLVLKYNSVRYEIMQQKKRDKEEEEEELDTDDSINDFIDDDSSTAESTTEESTDDSLVMSDDSRKKSKKKKKSAKKSKGKDKDKEGKGDGGSTRTRRGTRANPAFAVEAEQEVENEEIIELKNENPTEWWIKLVVDDELDDMRNSHKLVLLFDILRQCDAIGDKLLVFSQSLYSLDLIEHFLRKVDDATQEGRIDDKLGGHIGTWSQGLDYFRLDGSTSCENRSIWCKNFNKEDNPRARLFLISTRAGGLGINLVAANRVVIFDVSWNPSHDVQSIFRVYRFGQKKPCYVYRFLAMGTMEEKIYERQVTKQAISKRVIDEQQIDRHYAENDLAELYKFEPQPPTPRPIPPLPKDRLFAEMLREHDVQIYKYHEHDSLLENKEEETLSEEERKAAWEDFENEKNRPPPAPFPNTWQMPNIMQQQQLAYAALAAMLRKDMPNLSDIQLRDMLPLIYNSNPQLMQKLSEIYKYPQAMMNPAMMNPAVMNPVGGVGGMGGMAGLGGASGASGLQYEPPWQRQQQQQQQMRLQQMLQHQNQMGAKFYAGGLGSRDPVAMALQQQRAREIMLGKTAAAAGVSVNAAAGAGRPRGRPPMQARAPPSADVVNLDSD